MQFFKNFFTTHPELKYILGWFALTRFYLELVGILARIFVKGPNNFIYSKHIWLAIWGAWDSGWYLPLAKYGYSAIASIRTVTLNQANYAFFPFYPLLINFFHRIVGDYFVAGIIISNTALIIACIYLYKLASMDFDEPISRRAIKFCLIWPVSFIFSGVFTESLYLMLAVMVFYYARKRHWLAASVLGFGLALTRPVGVLIAIPLLFEYFSAINFEYKKINKNLIYFLLIPFGLGLFSYYNYRLTGDPLAFLKIQYAWGRQLGNPLRVLAGGLLSGNIVAIFNVSYMAVMAALILYFYKTIRPSYLIFAVYSLLIPLLSGLESMPRYLLVVFPIFIITALVIKKRSFNFALGLGLLLIQGVLMIFWTTGFSLIK